MNKQELIESIKNLNKLYGERYYVAIDDVLNLVKQLDEPEKVVIPQFVADAIEDAREHTSELEQAFQFVWWNDSDEFTEWYGKKSNRDVFARAWIEGYEVEKEKRYRISMPRARNHKNHAQILCEKDEKIFWCGEWYPFRTKFTRKELEEAGFGWVFDCLGIEIEEVEE